MRVNLTLDKTQFQVGEDIAAHIAAQVVEAPEPVYGEPNFLIGAFFQSIAGGFHLSISDEDGPLENSDRRANLYGFSEGSSGPIVCPGPLAVGKVIPLERSLRDFDLLPKEPGAYLLSVTWSPYHSRFSDCSKTPSDKPEQPFITVTSNPVKITVVGNPAATELPPYPEYTLWKQHFSLVDTSFGPRTALLDHATKLEWLRPSLTENPNMLLTELSMRNRMTEEKSFAGWRFATMDEVKSFFVHFTGSPDGTSQNPSIERKLLRLLGGTISGIPNEGGWIDNRVSVRIACGTHCLNEAFVREGVKDGQISVTIDPGQLTVRENEYEDVYGFGFFLVRNQNR